MSDHSRYAGFPYPDGLCVLDTWTGEVVMVPVDGRPRSVLRGPVSAVVPGPVNPPVPPGLAASTQVPPGAAAAISPAPPAERPAPIAPSPSATLDNEVISGFPYPIARSWRGFLNEADPRQRCKLMVDTFTHVIKLWALQTASEYLEAEEVKDIRVSHTLSRDFQRPLISAWNLLLARCLPVFEEHRVEPFSPELRQAYEKLESRCRDRVIIKTRYLDDAGQSKFRTSKFGKIQALIRYRNSLAHGYNQSRDKAESELATHLPVFIDVLKAARFMTRYPLFYLPPQRETGGEVRAYRMMGCAPSGDFEHFPAALCNTDKGRFFLHDPGRERVLPLHLFVDVNPVEGAGEAISGLGWDVLLYEGNTRTTVIYAAVSGAHVEKQGHLDTWRALLAKKAVSTPALTLDKLTWKSLCQAADQVTRATLETLVASGRYLREASVGRPRVERKLQDFERGDYRGFVIAGPAGIGKSTLLARYADERRAAGELVLFYRAANLRQPKIDQRILRDLGVRGAFFEDFLAALQPQVPDGMRVRVLVDAVSEHPGATAELVRAIDGLVAQADSYPWLRVVVTIRTAAYERLPPDARFGVAANARYFLVPRQEGEASVRTPLVEMAPLSSEKLRSTYRLYRDYRRASSDDPDNAVHVFRPITPFEELSPDGPTCALMRVPLLLRLIMTAFARRPLPSNLSFDDAMEPFLEYAVVERDRDGGGYPERRRFLGTLVRLMDAESAAALSRDRLYLQGTLKPHLENPQKDSAYVQLLDLGILLEDWDEDRCSVRFAFDGLFEYLLAELHYPRIEVPADLLALVERGLEFRNLRPALVGIMRRAIRDGRHGLLLDCFDLCPVGAGEALTGVGLLLVQIVRDLLVELARFRDPGFAVLLRELSTIPSRFDVLALEASFDVLFAAGEIDAAEKVADLAAAEAESLAEPDLQAGALLRQGQLCKQRGQAEKAFPLLDQARRFAEQAEDELLIHRIDSIRGRMYLTKGDLERAAGTYEDAYRGLIAKNAFGEASVARRGLASVVMRGGDLERAEALNREAIALAERADDLSDLAKALNNLAMVQTKKGDYAGARASFERSIEIKEKLGDRASIATGELNLGSLHYSNGEIDAAERRWKQALRDFEPLQHYEGRAYVMINLAIVAQLKRDASAAETYLATSLRLFEECKDLPGVAYALWLNASYAFDRGRAVTGRGFLERLVPLAEKLKLPHARLHRAALALRLALALRSDDEKIDTLVAEVKELSDTGNAAAWEVEEGPASALLDLAAHYRERGEVDAACAILGQIDDLVGGRPFARAAELADLVAATRDVAPASGAAVDSA